MSVGVRRVPVEERLKTWNFPLYPVHRPVQPTRTTRHIPSIEGRGLRLDGREEQGRCYVRQPTRSRPSSSSSARSIVLPKSTTSLIFPNSHTSLIFPYSRFNEPVGGGRSIRIAGRASPLSLECLQTNLRNRSQSTGRTVTRTKELLNKGGAAVTITILEDRQIHRSSSLPILLEKKSVEIKPRYQPKQARPRPGTVEKCVTAKLGVVEKHADKEMKKTDEKLIKQPVLHEESVIDHSISVTITDRRTSSVVRASSARAPRRAASSSPFGASDSPI